MVDDGRKRLTRPEVGPGCPNVLLICTGQQRYGVALPQTERLFTKDLAVAGYDCGLVGKLHLAACFGGRTEPRLGDGFRVFRWAHAPYPGSSENHYHRWLRASRPDPYEAARDPDSPVSFDTMPTEAHYSRWVGEETIDFLRSARQDGTPFCFVANFFDPHHGFDAPKEYIDRYEPANLSRPVTRADELTTKPSVLTAASRRQSLLPLACGDSGAHARGWALCEYRNSGHPYDPPVHTTVLRCDRWKIIVYHGDPPAMGERAGEHRGPQYETGGLLVRNGERWASRR